MNCEYVWVVWTIQYGWSETPPLLFSSCVVCDSVEYIEYVKPHFQTCRFKQSENCCWLELKTREKREGDGIDPLNKIPLATNGVLLYVSSKVDKDFCKMYSPCDIGWHLNTPWHLGSPPLFTKGNLLYLYVSSNFYSLKKDINLKAILLLYMCILITVHPIRIHIFMAIIASPLQSKWRTQFSKCMEQKIDEAIGARNIQFSAVHKIYFFARETLFLWTVSSYPRHFGILWGRNLDITAL